MGDTSGLVKQDVSTVQAAAFTPPDINAKLQADSAPKTQAATTSDNMGLGEKALRIGQVTGEGLLYSLPGALHAVEHDLDPANWKETGMKVLTAGALGVAMRVALPESGAIKAIAGTAMALYFAKDAAMPIFQGWHDVATKSGDSIMNASAQRMGEGLGSFAVDGYLSGKIAGFTGRMTPVLGEKYAPTQWAALESWKTSHLGASSTIGLGLNSFITSVDSKFKALGDKLNPPKPDIASLSKEEIMSSIAANQRANARSDFSEKIYAQGITGSDGNVHGLDGTVELLLQGKDPRLVPASAVDGAPSTGSMSQTEGWKQSEHGILVPDYVKEGVTATETPIAGVEAETVDAAAKGTRKGGGKGDGTVKTTTDAAVVTPKSTAANATEQILNADTMGKMAGVIKAQLAAVDDTTSVIRDRVNRTTSSVHTNTDPNFKPLDPGYQLARNAMVDLANQVGDDPRNFMQVDPLFTRLADATTQAHAQGLGPDGQHIGRMNTYAAENQSTYVRNMIAKGIDPEKAMAQKPLPALFELSDDQTPVGRDPKTGKVVTAHEGPHTVRAIYGPNGEPIWPIDMVKNPMRDLETRGYLTSGIYGHELGHDQYGQLGKLDPQVRDATLMAAAEKALGADANKMVTLPKATPAQIAESQAAIADAISKGADPAQFVPQDNGMPPLPDQMPMKEVMVNVAKAWADETFADWFAASESGQTAAPYFQALRKGGQLFNGTVMAEEMRSPDNPLGIEAHPVDKLRPRFQAALIRQLAGADGAKPDQALLDVAGALEKYSRDAGKPGDIVLASGDFPGQKITIPEATFDKFIPELVKMQLETPLPKLEGKTLFDILPDLRKNMRRSEDLSNLWVDAIKNGKAPETIPFDKNTVKMTNVYGAGQPTLLKLIAGGMDPMKAADHVNNFSDFFGNKFLDGDPHVDPIKTPLFKQLQLAPAKTIGRIPEMVSNQFGKAVTQQYQVRDWLGNNAVPVTAVGGSYMIQDLMGMRKKQDEVLNGSH